MATNLKIEHYVLGKTIGIGASGKVKMAKHEFTGTNVAIKIINQKKMETSNMGAKIKREIRLLRYFNHPNIIRLYEVLETQTDIYVVMELIEKGELFQVITQRGTLQEAEAKYYFMQIVNGVEYCHENLVTHRDLKLENILIDESNTVKIADFGLSNLMKDGKLLRTSCGSPKYAAPEIISGKKYCGVAADTWSCGVILFALLAGYLPFDDEVIPALFKKIREADYEIPSYISPWAADLIRRMLESSPLKRIQFSMIKNHPWIQDSELCGTFVELAHRGIRLGYTNKIRDDIFEKLMRLNFNFHNMNKNDIEESILKKKQYSFVLGYDLMVNECVTTEIAAKKIQNECAVKTDNTAHGVLDSIKCEHQLSKDDEARFYCQRLDNIVELEDNLDGNWIYGLIFQAHPRVIMQNIINILGEHLDTTCSIKSLDYKIKCHYRTKEHVLSDSNISTQASESSESPKKDDTFTKNELTFKIQIYQMPNKAENLVDVQRINGHTLAFLEYAHKFADLLKINMARVNDKNLT